jgi:cell division protein FtsB
MFFSLKNKNKFENISSDTHNTKIKPVFSGRLKVFAFVITGAFITILYVSNVMRVNSLLKDVNSRKKQYEKIRNYNQILNAKINELQSAERITTIAHDRLGMDRGQEAPVVLP